MAGKVVTTARPMRIVVAALGGQGGGVVTDWLIQIAKLEDHLVQATSVPGVAQRTGATIYYLEVFPRRALPADGAQPLMALMPHPADVDVVLASEIMEAGRALQRGIVTSDKTTLIASSHRVYAIGEKAHMVDGRADEDRVAALARQHAKRLVMFDMQAIASAHGSVISAAMLGGLAGSGALPFSLESYRKAIQNGGIAVAQSLAAFEAAALVAAAPPATRAADAVTYRVGVPPQRLQGSLKLVPVALHATVEEGARRLIDYQDVSYAQRYLQRLEPILAIDREVRGDKSLTEAVARGLALWMSFEDTIRVADLKIRTARRVRVREEARAGLDQLVSVTEFMKPRVHEICGTLPAAVGRRLLASPSLSRLLARLTGSRQIGTSRVGGFVLMYLLAGLRRWRRGTLRFADEDARIREWLALIEQAAARDYDLAVEIAECQQLVKGYGETHERGVRNFQLVVAKASEALGNPGAAQWIRALRAAASADEEGMALSNALAGGRTA